VVRIAVTGSPHSASLHTGYKGYQAHHERIGVWPLLISPASDKSLFLINYFLNVAPLGTDHNFAPPVAMKAVIVMAAKSKLQQCSPYEAKRNAGFWAHETHQY